MNDDLSAEALAEEMPGRPVRTYPAVLSTGADAMAWARSGGESGSVVVADYQASPRGRAGLEWTVVPGRTLSFSLIVRPELPPEREGWLYSVASLGVADALGPDTRVRWPDEIHDAAGERLAAVGVHAELGPAAVDWAVVNVLVETAPPPRPPLLRAIVESIERRLADLDERTLSDHGARCSTVGRRVRARLIPMGATGVVIAGAAVRVNDDGALVIERAAGTHIGVRPQNLGLIHDITEEVTPPDREPWGPFVGRADGES